MSRLPREASVDNQSHLPKGNFKCLKSQKRQKPQISNAPTKLATIPETPMSPDPINQAANSQESTDYVVIPLECQASQNPPTSVSPTPQCSNTEPPRVGSGSMQNSRTSANRRMTIVAPNSSVVVIHKEPEVIYRYTPGNPVQIEILDNLNIVAAPNRQRPAEPIRPPIPQLVPSSNLTQPAPPPANSRQQEEGLTIRLPPWVTEPHRILTQAIVNNIFRRRNLNQREKAAGPQNDDTINLLDNLSMLLKIIHPPMPVSEILKILVSVYHIMRENRNRIEGQVELYARQMQPGTSRSSPPNNTTRSSAEQGPLQMPTSHSQSVAGRLPPQPDSALPNILQTSLPCYTRNRNIATPTTAQTAINNPIINPRSAIPQIAIRPNSQMQDFPNLQTQNVHGQRAQRFTGPPVQTVTRPQLKTATGLPSETVTRPQPTTFPQQISKPLQSQNQQTPRLIALRPQVVQTPRPQRLPLENLQSKTFNNLLPPNFERPQLSGLNLNHGSNFPGPQPQILQTPRPQSIQIQQTQYNRSETNIVLPVPPQTSNPQSTIPSYMYDPMPPMNRLPLPGEFPIEQRRPEIPRQQNPGISPLTGDVVAEVVVKEGRNIVVNYEPGNMIALEQPPNQNNNEGNQNMMNNNQPGQQGQGGSKGHQ